MADVQSKAPVKRDPPVPAPAPAPAESKAGWLSWAVGWVLVPLTILGLIFGGGVLVGVHFHDSWLASLIMWFAGLF